MSNVVRLNGGQYASQELVDTWKRITDLEEELELERFENAEKRFDDLEVIGHDFARLVIEIDDLFGIRRLPIATRLRIEGLCERLGKKGRLWR